MTFLGRLGAPLHSARLQGRALDAWRSAAALVAARWDAFLVAEPHARDFAFAAYTAALDAEAVAADVLARVHLTQAA